MTDREKESIKFCNLLLNGDITLHILDDDGGTAYSGVVNKSYNEDLQTVLNLVNKQQAELEKKSKIIDKMAERLTTDIHSKEWVINYYERKVEK